MGVPVRQRISMTISIFVLLLFSSVLFPLFSAVKDLKGTTLYTKSNIWYTNPMEILTVHWHDGAIIPIGSEVTVTAVSKKAIEFELKSSGLKCRLQHSKKYSALSFEEEVKRFFTPDDPLKSEAYLALTELEKEVVSEGKLTAGMSKNAVLFSFGYPPSHKTPQIAIDLWNYWLKRSQNVKLVFAKNKLKKAEVKSFSFYSGAYSTGNLLTETADVTTENAIDNSVEEISYTTSLKESDGTCDFEKINEAVISIKTETGHGSGFIINTNGYALTNYHVVKGVNKVTAYLKGGKPFEATVVKTLPKQDLAIIKLPGTEYDCIPLNSKNDMGVGSEVYAFGSPVSLELSNSISRGIVSGIRYIKDKKLTLLQIDNSINGGNSGGPLVNKSGEVIGVVSAKIIGDNTEGLGFAISVSNAISLLGLKKSL